MPTSRRYGIERGPAGVGISTRVAAARRANPRGRGRRAITWKRAVAAGPIRQNEVVIGAPGLLASIVVVTTHAAVAASLPEHSVLEGLARDSSPDPFKPGRTGYSR